MRPLSDTELILNEDGSIYHLKLFPAEVSDLIITVGDPARVERVAEHFDQIEIKRVNREFMCCTGYKAGRRITVISTGIGYGGVEIVMNELDLLHNADFEQRVYPHEQRKQLIFIRLGTSGSISQKLDIGSLAISQYAMGFPDLHAFYMLQEPSLGRGSICYPHPGLFRSFEQSGYFVPAATLTLPGFYLPQGRFSAGSEQSKVEDLIFQQMMQLRHNKLPFDHIEMETAAIFQMAEYMGHQAISISAILADRINHRFHPSAEKCVQNMIEISLNQVLSNESSRS